MQNAMIAEQERLTLDVEVLDRMVSGETPPCGLKQRARSAFLKQLKRYKRERLDALSHTIGRVHAVRSDEHRRVGRI